MKFLYKILNFIKLMLKKPKQIQDNSVDLMDEEEAKIFNDVEIGDIIFAKRYTNELEKNNIPEGHREGPFIVVNKFKDFLICSQGTSVKHNTDEFFEIDTGSYTLKKDTYFRLYNFKIVDEFSYIKKIGNLTIKDRQKMFRQIKINQKNYYNLMNEKKKIDLPLQSGDIVLDDNIYYLILDEENDNFISLPLINFNLKEKLTLEKFKYIDYSNILNLNKNKNIKYISFVNNNIVLYALKKYREYINNINGIKIAQRGSVIFKNNKYYYIYGEKGQEWLIFEINKNNILDYDNLKIGNNVFYTNYNSSIIDKNDNFNILYLCFEDEIDTIKNKKKNYIENKKMNAIKEKKQKNELEKGCHIIPNENSYEEFIVKNILDDIVCCVSYIDRNMSKPTKHYFNKEDVIVIKSKRKRK